MMEIIAFMYLMTITTGGWRTAFIIAFVVDMIISVLNMGGK